MLRYPPAYSDSVTKEDVDEILYAVWTPEGVFLWWGRQRHQLDGRTPLEAWNDGDKETVYNLAVSGLGQIAT